MGTSRACAPKWSRRTKDLREVYASTTEAAAEQRFAEFEAAWGDRYPAVIRLWRDAWPTEQAALKVLYLVFRNPSKDRPNVTGTSRGWKAALNALSLHYGDRITLN